MRLINTKRGLFRIVSDKECLFAISTTDKDYYFEFDDINATDSMIRQRINETTEEYQTGEWISELDNIPKGIPLLLYSAEIFVPAVGVISEDDEVISSDTEYDHCPLNHIDQYMIIPDFEP